MGFVLFDASGLAKGYTEEDGAETMAAVFNHRGGHEFICTPWGYLETFAVMLRRRNNNVMSAAQFSTVVATLQAEILNPATFRLLTVDDAAIVGATMIVERHNLNATDAALLSTFLMFAQAAGLASCLLIASDKRLIRAARAENLAVLNPEEILPDAVPALLSYLP